MLANNFPLDDKSISRLSTRGLPLEILKSQIDESLDFTLELWRSQGLDIVKNKGYFYFNTKYFVSSQFSSNFPLGSHPTS